MLGGVLLHVVPAAGHVDFAVDADSRLNVFYGAFQVMHNAAVFSVGYFRDAKFVIIICYRDVAGVVDLAAAGGVKGGAVKNDGRARRVLNLADFGVEVVEERVVVVEALGHGKGLF